MPELSAAIAAIRAELRALRHDLHRFPEPGFEEQQTQARLRTELAAAGLAPRDSARTGLVVDLGGSAAGPTIALRADIDGLRMTEENAELPYRSERPGFAHMCGHDGHMAMLVGAARLLADCQDRLAGRVRLLFQPAEEGPGGAPLMIEEGALDGVDEIYGFHNWPDAPLGKLRTITGSCMAGVAIFEIVLHGRGGHASQPHLAIDPVVAAGHVITALQTITARRIDPMHSAVVSVTCVHGGEIHNVIPDSVKLTGSIRAFDDTEQAFIEERIREIAGQTAAAHGVRAECDIEHMYPTLVNDAAATAHVERVGRAVLGADNVSSDALPVPAAEDFAYFARERPACYFFLGSAEEGRTNAMCHATDYDFNDNLIDTGVTLWLRLVEDRLGVSLFD